MEKDLIQNFAEKMTYKLDMRKDRYQPMAWQSMDLKRLIKLLKGELEELEEGYKNNDKENIKEEAIDIANFALFIYEVANNGSR